jgi:hypothetical protein
MTEKMELIGSPFPGMDPYLEAADTWPDFHDALANEIRVELNKVLPAPYYARLQKRTELGLVLESGTLHRIVPDLTVLRRTLHEPSPAWEISTTTAVSMRPRTEATAGIDLRVRTDPIQHHLVEIRNSRRDHSVVTVIEIVSPSNKAPGPDRRSYEVKQAEVLSSDANLIEIDLLRSGRRLLPYPEMVAVVDDLNCDYLVVLNRSVLRQGDWMDYTLYPVNLQEPLPCILVPLAGQDPDVLLDLQIVADRVYEGGAYHRVVDYLAEPEPPLSSEDLAWADQLLRAAGLR